MTIPRAPSWTTVFLFGAAWNLVIERSWWATGLCLLGALLCGPVARLNTYLERKIR